MKNQKGFSLIELLIVVVIIGIIAAIAIPNLLASRRAANEASAISSLRVVGSSEATFFATSGNNQTYGTANDLCQASLIDGVLANSEDSSGANSAVATASTTCVLPTGGAAPKSGYNMTINPEAPVSPEPAHFTAGFLPAVTTGITQTGMRRFCMVEDGVLRADSTDLSAQGSDVATCTATPFAPTN